MGSVLEPALFNTEFATLDDSGWLAASIAALTVFGKKETSNAKPVTSGRTIKD
jgi:hypothetical protein